MAAVVVRPAVPADAAGIARVCADGWRDTYEGIYAAARIEAAIAEYYTPERIAGEAAPSDGWDGWIIAEDGGRVVGAGGGGMIGPRAGEVFVLYLDPARRREGIGSLLLDVITAAQVTQGAREQWVSVDPQNAKGVPFYRARGFEPQGERPAWGEALAGRTSLRMMRRLPG